MRVPAPLGRLFAPLPETPTPGGGEMTGVPFCQMGLDACPCCWAVVCVLVWVAEVVPVAAVEAVWDAV